MAGWTADRLGPASAGVVCVFVHGGFWRARYGAETIAPLAEACARDGMAWAWNVEYPRVGMAGGGWPGTALAVRDAVAAAVGEAAGRPVVVIGHSAGGHLALWVAGEQPVAGVISLAGVCDLRAAARARLGDGAVAEFAGGQPDDAFYAAASPAERLPLRVPALLVHGDEDENVPIEQSRSYAAAARAAGDVVTLRELSGADHFDVIDPHGSACAVVREWLEGVAAAPSDGA